MSTIRLRLAEYLKCRGFTPENLVEAVGETLNPETVYQLIEKAENLSHLDLSVLAAIIDGLSKLNGFPVGIAEVLIFFPDISDEALAKSPWRQLYLVDNEIPPYDWGDVDPLEGTKPVRFIPGVGIVILDNESATNSKEDIQQFTRITCDSQFMAGKPCIRNLPITVETIISMMASHYSTAEIRQTYPELEEADFKEVIAYAKWRIQETNPIDIGNKKVEKICESAT
ncbi:DUF433 domain-containing protein [Microcoleus sp. w1-18aA5]|uniref:DUF433 domain-containing protein n=1 Tax=unclassified Microcoleus TaxID=2642155 RepID=UPI002FCECE55